MLPALAGLTRLTSLDFDSEDADGHNPSSFYMSMWPDLAPLAALTALERLRLSCWDVLPNDLCERLWQLPAGSLGALTQLRLHSGDDDSVCVDDLALAALAWAAPALQVLDVNRVLGLDEEAPGSAPPWTMPHLTTLVLNYEHVQSVSVVCAAALLARAPRLCGLRAAFATRPEHVPLEVRVRALARIAAAGRATLSSLDVWRLPPAAELQAAMVVAAPSGIALEVQVLQIDCYFAPDDQQVAWLRSVLARVHRVDVRLPSETCGLVHSRGIFALPAAAFCLRVDFYYEGGCLLEAVRFAAEAARPGQQVLVRARDGAFGADTIAEAEAIACCALDKDIRIQIGGQVD